MLPTAPGAQFCWFAPSASRGRARHIRDCSLPFQLGWHTILALPRVRGSVNVVAAFYVDCFNWQRSPALGFRAAVCPPHTSNLYRAVMQCARATEMAQPVAHPCWTRPSWSKWGECPPRMYWFGPTLPKILCHQPDREFFNGSPCYVLPKHFAFDLTTKWHLYRPEPTHLFQSFSSAQRVLSDFPRGVVATSHLLGRGVFTLTNTRMVLHGLVCRPNPRYGAIYGIRTRTTSLEDSDANR